VLDSGITMDDVLRMAEERLRESLERCLLAEPMTVDAPFSCYVRVWPNDWESDVCECGQATREP
jgi:hypothetical protein